jgi:hypothetical protein
VAVLLIVSIQELDPVHGEGDGREILFHLALQEIGSQFVQHVAEPVVRFGEEGILTIWMPISRALTMAFMTVGDRNPTRFYILSAADFAWACNEKDVPTGVLLGYSILGQIYFII